MKVWKFSLRYLYRNIWQTLLLILGIVLGVAVVVAIDFSNESARTALNLSTQSLVEKSTHQLVAASGGIPEVSFVNLKNSGIIELASPVVEGYISLPKFDNQPLQLLGVDPLMDLDVRDIYGLNSTGLPELVSSLSQPNTAIISVDNGLKFNLQLGSLVDVEYEGKNFVLEINGLIDNGDPLIRKSLDGIVLVDISTAQELLSKIGRIDKIDLILASAEQIAVVERNLPAGIFLVESNQEIVQVNQMISAFQLNLTALSLLALVVGLFLIYNTMTFSIVQRRELIGNYRSFGFYRREIFLMVIFEALIIGMIGTAGGLAAGVLLGRQTIGLILQTINDLYFVTTVKEIGIPAISLLKGTLLGLLATIAVTIPPAWEATRVTPRNAAIRSNLEQKTGLAINRLLFLAIFFILLAAILLFVPMFTSLWWAFAATFFIVGSFGLFSSIILNFLLPPLSKIVKRSFGLISGMAVRELHRSLSRTAIAISSLMVAISVTMGMTIMIESFRSTVEVWLKETLVGDIYVSVPSQFTNQSSALIDPSVAAEILMYPGIESWNSLGTTQQNTPAGDIQINVITNDRIAYERLFIKRSLPIEQIWGAMRSGGVLLSEPLANRLNLEINEILSLDSPNGVQNLPVIGIFYDYASNQGHLLINKVYYEQFWPEVGVTALSIDLKPDEDIAATVSNLIRENQMQIQKLVIRDNKTLQADAISVFDRTFRITNALRFIATIISVIGIVSAVLLIIFDRKREFGILKAMGLNPLEMWRLILTETGLMGIFAGIFAIPTGYIISLILVYVINLRSFGWTIQFQFNWIYILQTLGIAWLASIIAGIFPILQINRLQTIEVIRNE